MSATKHIGLLTFAKDFLRAAHSTQEETAYPTSLPLAGNYLVGHALELAFKSALCLNGASEKELRQVGHDLEVALTGVMATPQAKHVRPDVEGVVALINPYYKRKELEYFVKAMGMRLPNANEALRAASTLIAALDAEYREMLRNGS